MHPAFQQTEHRVWPLPRRPWAMSMGWHELGFLHWPVPAAALQRWLPAGLEIDTWHGQAWLGVVPFRMSAVCPRHLPSHWLGFNFPELNLRTYVKQSAPAGAVDAQTKPGVWFFSLDASSWLSVRVARWWYGLPYFDAQIEQTVRGSQVHYHSQRTHRGVVPATLEVSYQPSSTVQLSQPGSFEYWLTERYCLYSQTRQGQLRIGHIHHQPWPLQTAEVEVRRCDMTRLLELELPAKQPVAHYAHEVQVVAWDVEPV